MVWMYTSCSIANIITTTVNQLCLNNADVINQVVYESHNLCHSPLTRTKLIHVALIYKWVLPFDINYDSTNKIYRSIDQIIPKLTYLTISILMYLPAWCNDHRARFELGRSLVWAPVVSKQDYKICIFSFFDKHTVLRSNCTDWLGSESG
jgi:hypothetical protein